MRDDLANPQNLPQRCEYVIHAAADTPNTTKDENQIWKSNYDGMKNLLSWCSSAGVRHFINFSTISVYGAIDGQEIDESTPSINPDSYGASKLAAENLLQNYAQQNSRMSCLTIRLSGVVGRGAKDTFLPRTVQKILEGEPVSVYNKKALFNNVVYVIDLANFVLEWANRSSQLPYIMFNLGSEGPITLFELAKILMTGLDNETPVIENIKGRLPFLVNTELARKHGFPLRSTSDTLVKYVSEINSTK